MSMLGAVAEVMMVDAVIGAARGNPGQQKQRNSYSPLRMLEAALCFEFLSDMAGPAVGMMGTMALMESTRSNTPPVNATAAKTNTPVNQPRTQQRQPTPGLNLAPGAPTF